ncbi:MAG: FAD binding domain-containing protein [Bacillota bacterium]|jgi:CO/xanthine dehydrogenase FAD-binding subunit
MKNFAYVNAPTVEAALDALAAHDNALIVAGGTDVMIGILGNNINDRTIVDIHAIDGLKEIVDNGDTITLGALVTLKQIENSELLEKDAKCLWQAGHVFADPTTRNSATVGGNLGKASPAGDTLPSLLVLDAVLTVEKKGSKREVSINDYFKGPGKTCLEAGEMITHVTIKKSHNCCFVKLGLRKAMAISVASVAVAVEKSECGCCKNARVAMGSVAATPVRCAKAEAAIENADGNLTEALEAALAEDIHPIDDFRATGRYRAMVAPGLVERALKNACGC